MHEFNYGGVTCRQVEANIQQYAMNQLPPDTQRAFTEHLAHCPHCQENMKAMQRGAMPVGTATAIVTERVGERIVMSLGGETVTIELLKIAGSPARVGVEAPTSVVVHRHEAWDRMALATECPVGREPLARQAAR